MATAGQPAPGTGPRRKALGEQSARILAEGYGWLPDLRRRAGADTARFRVLGRPAVVLCGPDSARFFYDEDNIRRAGAIPGPVQDTLFGRGAVHTLDGAAHRARKDFFQALVTPESTASLVRCVGAAWEDAVVGWRAGSEVVLFDEAARALTTGVRRWAGIPVPVEDIPDLAGDLVAMVDGFASVGPRHRRARKARARREEWLTGLVREVRSGEIEVPEGSAVDAVVHHRDGNTLLDSRTAAVELLNVVRPTVAVAWFVAFTGHALRRWPGHRAPLAAGGDYATAFAHEVRRFYPFAPFVGGRAVRDLHRDGVEIPEGALVLLDLYGQDHDERWWSDPYRFDPSRFMGHAPGEYDPVPQGAGDPATGHRCPGEPLTVAVLADLATRLATLDYRVPSQELGIPLSRVPTRPRAGLRLIPSHPHLRPVSALTPDAAIRPSA